ncbi:hypothetical protein CVT26_013462, partial [Gymnopilus dilepis]
NSTHTHRLKPSSGSVNEASQHCGFSEKLELHRLGDRPISSISQTTTYAGGKMGKRIMAQSHSLSRRRLGLLERLLPRFAKRCHVNSTQADTAPTSSSHTSCDPPTGLISPSTPHPSQAPPPNLVPNVTFTSPHLRQSDRQQITLTAILARRTPKSPTTTTSRRQEASFERPFSCDTSTATADLEDDAQVSPTSTTSHRLGTALKVISQILKVATAATSFLPHAQCAIGGVASGVEMAKISLQNQADRKVVKKNLLEALKRVNKCGSGVSLSPTMAELILRLKSDLLTDFDSVDETMKESWWKRLVEGDAQALNKHYAKLSSVLGTFIAQTVITTDGHLESLTKVTAELKSLAEKNNEAISRLLAKVELKELNCAPEAGYDAGPANLRRACTIETRKQILTDLMVWATDDSSPQVYWLSGMAGTGKTSIAYSFCQLLEEADLLCNSFFCSRTVNSTTDTRSLLPSLAYHLASHSASFSQALFSALRAPSNANVRQKELERQFETLIAGPTGLSSKSSQKLRIFVYDGADEASDLDEVAKLIGLFLKYAGRLPFKIFISSRREAVFKQEFGREGLAEHCTSLLLHEVEENLVETDIRHHILERLHRVSHLISETALDTLVERSGKLFVYASVLCSFLDKGSEEEVQARLAAILANSTTPIGGTTTRPHDNLDQIYTQILDAAEIMSTDIWPVLLIILTTRSPLTAASITNILGFEHRFRVPKVIESLHSVLTGSESDDVPVTIFHSSFRDFLGDDSRGARFCHLISSHQYLLATCCLKVMRDQLVSNNICEISNDCVRKAKVKVHKYISAELGYACINCFSHLMELSEDQLVSLQEDLLDFFDHRVLRWIECMAWLDQFEAAETLLQQAALIQALGSDVQFAAMDARQAVVQCPIIKAFPLEVYRSALVWLPRRSRLRERFKFCDWQVISGLPETWGDDSPETVDGGFLTNHLLCIAFSEDGKWVASGSTDLAVRIWDVETGQEKRKFEGHTGHIQSICFSPDGQRVISGSDDRTIRVWNLETGEEEKRLEGHSDSVRSVSSSPDGRTVVSASSDTKIRIWDLSTGQEKTLNGHSGVVHLVSFSHDGTKVVSGSSMDQTVRIWDIQTGEQKEMKGDPGILASLSFSDDDKKVVAVSDCLTVKIWDVESGETKKLKKRQRARQATVSHNRQDFISGTLSALRENMTLSRIWVPQQFRHLRDLVVFSPRAVCYANSDRLFIVRSAHKLQPYTFTI